MRTLKIALLGYGTVGQAVAAALLKSQDLIASRCGARLDPVIALARSPKPDALIPITTEFEELLAREDVDIFVELIGGLDAAFKMIQKLSAKNKPIITANKALLATHGEKLAGLVSGYEASVAGGIPIIKILREGLAANKILKIKAILNGTSNYILTKMSGGMSFTAALARAKNKGYAEADPSMDISGQDSLHKLIILARIAYGLAARPEEVLCEGIVGVSAEDLAFAHEFDYEIKLLGIAELDEDEGLITLRVHPALIAGKSLLAQVGGVMNAISITGDILGENLYYGAGAGGGATASAVIADLIEVAKKILAKGEKTTAKNPAEWGPQKIEAYALAPREELATKYYLRLRVADELGVLARITQVMSEHEISVESFLQRPLRVDEDEAGEAGAGGGTTGQGEAGGGVGGGAAGGLGGDETKGGAAPSTLFFTTHETCEKNIRAAMAKLGELAFILEPPFMLRIE